MCFGILVTVIVDLSPSCGCAMLSLSLDVHLKWQKLSEESCHQVFKPSHAASSSQDELLIPDTELQRIHTLGRKHTHPYTHMLIIKANPNEEKKNIN